MGTTREEDEARRLLRGDGAVLTRTTGKHEIWRLSNGVSYPLPCYGRKSSTRLWKNLLSQLRNALAGREHRQGRVCSLDGRPIHLAPVVAVWYPDEQKIEEGRQVETALVQSLGIKPELKIKRRMIEERDGRIPLAPHQVVGLLRLTGVADVPDDAVVEFDLDDNGYVVLKWRKTTETDAS